MRKAKGVWPALFILAVVVLLAGGARKSEPQKASQSALRKPSGQAQLVSIQPMPEIGFEGEMCQWTPASASLELAAFWQAQPQASPSGERRSVFLDQPPVRTVRDTYPTYSAVAVDLNSDEVYLQDENLFGFNVFNRLDNTPPTAAMTEPKRTVRGRNTKMDFNCALYVDPSSGDVYSVNNDVVDTLTVWPRGANGDVPPKRALRTPPRTWGIAVDEGAQEMFLTTQHPAAVLVYRKTAEGQEAPIRVLEGRDTGLEDPHGIAIDTKNQWLFVNNFGSVSFTTDGRYFERFRALRFAPDRGSLGFNPDTRALAHWVVPSRSHEDRPGLERVPGSGKFEPPSITVYPLKASGNTKPLRVIEGPNTQLNWPAHMSIDSERGELFVANDVGDSILVFSLTASGNAAPTRILKGPRTGLENPVGIYADSKNRELWVSNFGNHSATVYPLDANGDVAPLRIIRSAPLGKQAIMIGNPGAISYDTKREEILVPN